MTDIEKTNLLFFASEANGDNNEKSKETSKYFLNASLARKLAAEVVGTYALTLVATASGSIISVGFVLAALIYAFGHVSGGHFNPAVTMAVFLRGGLVDMKTALAYAAAQVTGAFIGGAQHNFARTDKGLAGLDNFPAVHADASAGSAFLSELTATMIFTAVILNVATTRTQAKNQFFGIAIGFVLVGASSSITDVSGGCLNPALGLALSSLAEQTDDIWIYIVAPLLGAALGAGVFRLTSDPSEFK